MCVEEIETRTLCLQCKKTGLRSFTIIVHIVHSDDGDDDDDGGGGGGGGSDEIGRQTDTAGKAGRQRERYRQTDRQTETEINRQRKREK